MLSVWIKTETLTAVTDEWETTMFLPQVLLEITAVMTRNPVETSATHRNDTRVAATMVGHCYAPRRYDNPSPVNDYLICSGHLIATCSRHMTMTGSCHNL